MMSKRKWFFVLCLFIVYLLLGAVFFFSIESVEEDKRLDAARQERRHISELLQKHMSSDTEQQVFIELSNYCGKTVNIDMSDVKDEHHWDFYHSLFFVITVVSTIGYGNLAPTVMTTRIVMIFYGLIGIPMNGIVMVTLGGYFGRSFTKLYQRWKTSKMQNDTTRLGLISQIILYLVPGFTFFMFLPSVIMVMVEGWTYDQAVYYCFVTLTTIGFGDIVAGVHNENNIPQLWYTIYKVFLLVWVIIGLGYLVMIVGFITQGMQSRKMKEFEKMLKSNFKRTPLKIRQELRGLLQEFLFMKVKRVYKDEFQYVPCKIGRSQSCPDLTIYRNMDSPTMQRRKRALSECPRSFILNRIQSDTDLELIDKERTFKPAAALMHQKDLLLKVVDALGNLDAPPSEPPKGGYDMFSDEEILASEQQTTTKRRRAISENNGHTWYGQDANNYYQQFRQRALSENVETVVQTPPHSFSFFSKIKQKIIPSQKGADERLFDIERQDIQLPKKRRSQSIFADQSHYLQQTARGRPSILSLESEQVLEQTSIADFLRALSAIADTEDEEEEYHQNMNRTPRRKIGNAGISPPRLSPSRRRRAGIQPTQLRRGSLMPAPSIMQMREGRRFSLRPVDEQSLAPPPYTPTPIPAQPPSQPRKFSRTSTLPVAPSTFVGPVQKQLNKRDKDQ